MSDSKFREGEVEARRDAMAVLAQARGDEIEKALSDLDAAVTYNELRPPESGLVMLRGRIGADGAPFNFGEATVTRAAIRIDTGETGFSYVLGRDEKKARLAALCDALLQSRAHGAELERKVVAPLRAAQASNRAKQQAKTAATRVEFFTLVRGENA